MGKSGIRKIRNKGVEVKLDQYEPLTFDHQTRNLFDENQNVIRSGALRDFLARPRHIAERNVVFFDHVLTEGASDFASRSRVAGKKIPLEQLEELKRGVDELKAKLKNDGLPKKSIDIIKAFQLPDPVTHPEFYRLYGSRWNGKLVVLWGCQKKTASSLSPLAAVDRLRDQVMPERLGFARRAALLMVLLLLGLLVAAGIWCVVNWPSANIQVAERFEVGQLVVADCSQSQGESLGLKWDTDSEIQLPAKDPKSARRFLTAGEKTIQLTTTTKLFGYFTVTDTANQTVRVEEDKWVPPPKPADSPNKHLFVTLDPQSGRIPNQLTIETRFPPGDELPGILQINGSEIGIQGNQQIQYDDFDKPDTYRIRWNPVVNDKGIESEFVDVSLWDIVPQDTEIQTRIDFQVTCDDKYLIIKPELLSLDKESNEITNWEIQVGDDKRTIKSADDIRFSKPNTDVEITVRATDKQGKTTERSRPVPIECLDSTKLVETTPDPIPQQEQIIVDAPTGKRTPFPGPDQLPSFPDEPVGNQIIKIPDSNSGKTLEIAVSKTGKLQGDVQKCVFSIKGIENDKIESIRWQVNGIEISGSSTVVTHDVICDQWHEIKLFVTKNSDEFEYGPDKFMVTRSTQVRQESKE